MAKHYGIDGVGTLVELGKGGPKINNAAGVVEIKNNANNAYADLTAFKATVDSVQLATAPTVGPYSEGHLFYDATWKTLSAEIGRDVTLQIGQEDLRRVYNNTGVTIYNGQAVYASGVYGGGTNDVITVALAKADSATTAFLLGCATQDISDSDYGFVTVRGHINGLDTNRIGSAYLTTQGVVFDCLVGGTAGNAYTFTVIDTTSGGLTYTEVGGAIIVDLGGATPTRAQLATLINTTTPSAYVRVAVESSGNVIVASVLPFAGGVETVAGDVLYLSAAVPGKLRIGVPDAPNLEIRVGRIITKSATVGRINIRIYQGYRLNDLTDVASSLPAVDDTLKWNGSSWVNGPPVSSSASAGIDWWPDTTDIIAKTTENAFVVETLGKLPVTTAQVVEAIACTNNTVVGSAYLYDTALGRTTLEGGSWAVDAYCSVSSTGAGRISSATFNMYTVRPYTSPTVTVTGSGTSRTCTASSGTPFAVTKIAASATNTLASFVQTPKGMYQITAITSDTAVTILTPTGYNNESTVGFSVWKKFGGVNTGTITTLTTNYGLYAKSFASAAVTIEATDKLGMVVFGTSNNTTTVNYVYNGTANYSHFSSPLITLHNNLAGLNAVGGNYQHLTDAQLSGLTGGTSTTLHSHAVPTTITVAAEATDQTCYPLFVTGANGSLAPKTHAAFGFDALNGWLGVGTATPSSKLHVTTTYTNAYGTAVQLFTNTTLTTNGSLYNIGQLIDCSVNNVTAGVTDSGYKACLQINNTPSGAGFAGTQTASIGLLSYSGIGASATAGATITNAYGVQIANYNLTSGTTVTNSYGVHVNSKNSTVGTITNAWDIYAASSTSYNYFAGKVGMGITVPTAALHVVTGSSANIDTVILTNVDGPNYFALRVNGYSNLGGFRINAVDGANALYNTLNTVMGFTNNVGYDIVFGSWHAPATYNERLRISTTTGNILIGTPDDDGTPATGRLVVQGGSYDGTTNIFVGRDSNGANVFLVASNGRTAITTGTYAPIASHLQVGADSDGTLTAGARIPVLLVVGKYNDTDEVSLLRLVRPLQSSQLFAASVDFKMKCWGSLGSPFLPATQLTISLKGNGGYDSSDVFDVITFRDDRTVLIGETTYTQNAARLVIKGSTNNGTTDILVGLDSDAALVASLNTNGVFTAIGGLVLGLDAATNTAGTLKMFAAGANAYYNTFTSGINTANATYTWPLAMPTSSGYVLSCTDAGVMSWAAAPAAATMTVVADTTDQTCYPLFVNGATGDLAVKTHAAFGFDALNGWLGVGIATPSTRIHVVEASTTADKTAATIALTTVLTDTATVYNSGLLVDISGLTLATTKTDSGIRTGLHVAALATGAGFAGTQNYLIGQRVYAGIGASCTSGAVVNYAYGGYFCCQNESASTTLTTSIAVYANSTNVATGTITNAWDIYAASATARSYFAGNVGIKVVAPLYPLHVVGDSVIGTNLLAYAGFGEATIAHKDIASVATGYAFTTNAAGNVAFNAAFTLDFRIGNVQQARVTPDFFGIGTTDGDGTPATGKLVVQGLGTTTQNIFVGRDSNGANVTTLDCAGLLSTSRIALIGRLQNTGGTVGFYHQASTVRQIVLSANSYYDAGYSYLEAALPGWLFNLAAHSNSAADYASILYRAPGAAADALTEYFRISNTGVAYIPAGIVLGLDAATNTAGYIKMFAAGANAYYNTFTSGENTANANYTLPLAPPTVNGQLMSCTTAGVLSWAVAPKKTIILPAAAAALGTTTPATRETREIGTTARPVVDVLKFPHASIAFAWWKFILPDSYDGGTLTAKISYTNIATEGTTKFLFTISAACLADGGPLDVTMGTAVELEATVADTAEDVKIASWGTAITPSGTPAGGQVILIKLQRDPADTDHDTTALDAYVLDLAIEYTTNSWTD